jgi:L-lactate dehydrogenase complex protein LldG
MNSREHILKQIAANKPQGYDLNIDFTLIDNSYTPEDFIKNLTTAGGKVHKCQSLNDINDIINNDFNNISNIYVDDTCKVNINNNQTTFALDKLNKLELAIIQGDFGVNETGSIWVNLDKLPHRSLPFITLHLMLVINSNSLVANMYQAYQQIGTIPDYGVFITGPSKTADIERCTVIGAHGPISLTVVLI